MCFELFAVTPCTYRVSCQGLFAVIIIGNTCVEIESKYFLLFGNVCVRACVCMCEFCNACVFVRVL
jgi:hypothetical protein